MKSEMASQKTPSLHKTIFTIENARDVLSSFYKADISDLELISGGEGSQAFSFVHSDMKYVLRVSKHSDQGYKKDDYANKHFSVEGLPIPKQIALGETSDGYYFAISEKSPGTVMNRLEKSEQIKVVPEVVKIARTIHSVDISNTTGFGKWNEQGVASCDSWAEFLLRVDIFAKDLFGNSFLEKDIWDQVYKRFVELLPACPTDRYLVHGDMGFGNLLVDDGQVSGIIDWEGSLYGDYLYDIAWLCFWSKDTDQVHMYQQTYSDVPRFAERLLCYQLCIGLGSLSFFAYSEQQEKYEKSKKKLLDLLGQQIC